MLKKRAIAKSFHKAIQSVASFLTSFIKKIPSKYFQYPRVRIYFLIFVALGFSFILSLLLFRPLRQLRDSQPTFPPSTIITKDTGTYSFKNTTNEFTTHFKAKPTEPDSIAFANHLGKISFYTPKTQIFGELNTYSSPISSGSTLTYPNIFPNLDLRYTLSSSRLLEEFIANDRATAVRLTRIQQIAQTSQKYHTNDDGSLTFTNEKNQTVFSIPAPVLYEQKDTTQRSSGIRYEIQANSAGQLTITKVLTAEGLAWINDPKRIFPIVIDLVIDNADTSTNWTSSDSVDTPVSQETTIKEEGSGSVKVQTTAATNSTVDLMEYTSDVNAQAAYVSNEFTATGGTQTTSGIYRIHSFTTSGTFTPSASSTVQALVVAGGGNGGSTTNDCLGGGGGGAGGLIYNSSFAVTAQA